MATDKACGAIKLYTEPRVFLIDMDEGVKRSLLNHWAEVGTGTLGKPYEIEPSSKWVPVKQHEILLNYEESDIIIVDLSRKKPFDQKSNGPKHTPDSEIDLWAKCDVGWIDARARTAIVEQESISRIVKAGGILVIFAGPESPMEFGMAMLDYMGSLEFKENVKGGVWNILKHAEFLNFETDVGSVINVVDDSAFGLLLQRHLVGARFECVFENKYSLGESWTTLAVNKFGQKVSMIVDDEQGTIMIFPQVADKASFVEDLLTNVLPELSPGFFPQIEKAKWTYHDDYEIEEITELKMARDKLREQVDLEIQDIESRITDVRSAEGWIHELLTCTGDELVNAIKEALSYIGFDNVIDMDELRDGEGKSRREDLRIEGEPLLIIDIKGVGGKASDEDLTQASKHVLINIQESGSTLIKGLSIVNQQRHIPPLQRDNENPFRKEMLKYADQTNLGLLTTFDLYRLIVNKKRHGWTFEVIKPLFYMSKRIEPVPQHYKYLGVVAKVFTGVLAMHMEDNEINLGDRLAVEGGIYFEEVDVASIMIHNEAVGCAKLGDPAGFTWNSNRLRLRPGMRVFAIPAASHS
jgi:hypothetical protein